MANFYLVVYTYITYMFIRLEKPFIVSQWKKKEKEKMNQYIHRRKQVIQIWNDMMVSKWNKLLKDLVWIW